jgi:ABC-2 type transport system permease protein
MVIAGLTLVWKRVQILNDLTLMLVLFFSGAILPAAELPGWAEAVSWPLFLTHSMAGLRTVMLDGATVPAGGFGGWTWMLTTAAAWLTAGLLAFRTSEHIAKRQGSLTRY